MYDNFKVIIHDRYRLLDPNRMIGRGCMRLHVLQCPFKPIAVVIILRIQLSAVTLKRVCQGVMARSSVVFVALARLLVCGPP